MRPEGTWARRDLFTKTLPASYGAPKGDRIVVLLLDAHRNPLMPGTEKRARQMLERVRAVVHQMAPFTLRRNNRTAETSIFQPIRMKFDPGSKTTGVAIPLEGSKGPKVVFFGEIVHKVGIKARLDARRALRQSRRHRKTRYRKPRFQNRKRNAGWLPPSLEARVDQTLHALVQIQKRTPITHLSVEHVKFDTQKLENPEISGVEYQQGTLVGYEVREYLLEKWGRRCAYCGKTDVPLQVEHIVPKAREGSNRVSNLTLACEPCNRRKGKRTANEFGCPDIQAQARKPLKDPAMMNATRWRLYVQLQATGLPVEGGSGARTKMQRTAHNFPKEHYYDALCVGESTPERFTQLPATVQIWMATGRGTRQMCGTNQYGFPIRHRSRQKIHFGFQTGDPVKAVVPRGKYTGTHTGRVLVRASGSFDLSADGQRIAQGISYKHCRILQRNGGRHYAQKPISA